MMSFSVNQATPAAPPGAFTDINGSNYRHCNLHKFFHSPGSVQHHSIYVATRNQFNRAELIDRGANGSVGGSDVRVIIFLD